MHTISLECDDAHAGSVTPYWEGLTDCPKRNPETGVCHHRDGGGGAAASLLPRDAEKSQDLCGGSEGGHGGGEK
eukprot:8114716-Pyramimonas_sp.AAC.1